MENPTYILNPVEARKISLEARYFLIQRASREALERGDCTVRALAMCCNLPYNYAHNILKLAGRKNRKGVPSWKIFNIDEGCSEIIEFYTKKFKVTRYARPKMTIGRFRKEKSEGIYYVIIPSHAYAQIDGMIFNQDLETKFIKYYFEIKPIK